MRVPGGRARWARVGARLAALAVVGALAAWAVASRAPSGDGPGILAVSGPDGREPDAVALAGGGALLGWQSTTGGPIEVTRLAPGASRSAPVALAAPPGRQVALAAADGVAEALWQGFDGGGRRAVLASVLRGGRWTSARILSGRGDADAPQAAGAAAGMLAAWRTRLPDGNVIEAAATRPDGRLGPVVRLTDPVGAIGDPAVAVSASGRQAVVWRRRSGSGWLVIAAVRDRPAGGWRLVRLARLAGLTPLDPIAGLDAAGRLTAVWLADFRGRWIPQAAQLAAGRVVLSDVGPPLAHAQPLPRIGGNQRSFAADVSPGGAAAVAWTASRSPGTLGVAAAERDSGGAWAPPLWLSPPREASSSPVVAETAGGRALVAWVGLAGHAFRVEASAIGGGCRAASLGVVSGRSVSAQLGAAAADGPAAVRLTWLDIATGRVETARVALPPCEPALG